MTDDVSIYRRQEFGQRIGFGANPALVVVDFTVGFNDAEVFGGGNIDAAVKRTVGLLEAARGAGLPVVFTRIVYAGDGSDAGIFCLKVPRLGELTEDSAIGQIVPELAPKPGEIVLRKRQPSAFFATDLAGLLTERGVDTVIVAGCTTSGCVRASVIDAMSYGFRPIVVTDCVGDRALGPHDANIFDMGQKYADLMTRDEVIATLEALRKVA